MLDNDNNPIAIVDSRKSKDCYYCYIRKYVGIGNDAMILSTHY